ncbi:3'-5' exonuclease [Aliarcobacter cryaerophilus]|uniref:3'-5' exonuclease n=1 Tax=Aliarcobacter cryaerophilus TaxID=28198 RepID=UPI0021B41120|nr:3'-5' exonuclease [Aliarcobacter cryaerophilus]MCT7464711.1 3'-5' exonuclease [Aliarcobacter cryaerophilus]
MAKYVLFDTETTGGNEEDRIIQIGSMIIDTKEPVEIYDELCSVDIPIKIEAMEVHNITPCMIENKPKFVDTNFYKRLQELNSDENYLIAHNLPFDLGMLIKEGFKNRFTLIDTLRCSRHLLPDSPYHRLQYLRYSLELYKNEAEEAMKHNITIKAHDAIGDVLVMKLFLSKLVTLAKEKAPEINPMKTLAELTKTPIFIKDFKFGKYKGRSTEEIYEEDKGYILWFLNSMEHDVDMKYTLNKLIGKK